MPTNTRMGAVGCQHLVLFTNISITKKLTDGAYPLYLLAKHIYQCKQLSLQVGLPAINPSYTVVFYRSDRQLYLSWEQTDMFHLIYDPLKEISQSLSTILVDMDGKRVKCAALLLICWTLSATCIIALKVSLIITDGTDLRFFP